MGWRGIFGLLGIAAAGLLLLAVTSLPETNRQRAPLPGARALLTVYASLLRRPEFRAYAIGGACMSTSIYAFLSASPFLFTGLLQRPSGEVGLYYMAVVAGVTLGSWLAEPAHQSAGHQAPAGRRRRPRHGRCRQPAGAGTARRCRCAGLLGTMSLFAIGSGVTSPVATARHQRRSAAIGAASGLYGAADGLRRGCAPAPPACGIAGQLVAIILLASAVTAQIAFFVARKRMD